MTRKADLPLWPQYGVGGELRLARSVSALLPKDASLPQTLAVVGSVIAGYARAQTGIPLHDPSSLPGWLSEKLGLSPAEAVRLSAQLAVISAASLGDEITLPDALDNAGPLVDRLAPRTERKAQGLFVTSAPIAQQLARLLINDAHEPVALLDNAAGTGTLALAALQRLLAHSREQQKVLAEVKRSWRLIEKSAELAAIASLQLIAAGWPNWPPGEDKWPVHCGDGLASPDANAFTHVIGNPPYIGEKQARLIISQARTTYPDLADAYRGKADFAFLFVLRGLLSLVPGGRLAMLTPAYWPTADGAQSLRQTLRNLADIRIEAPEGVIKSARGVELIILNAVKRTQPRQIADGAPLYWRQSDSLTNILETMARLPRCLGGPDGPLEISAGIQTGADRVTAAHLSALPTTHRSQIGDGIFVLRADEADRLAERFTDAERALIKPLYKSPAIGPFILDTPPKNGWRLLYLDGSIDIKDLPAIHKHLLPFKSLLSQRREVQQGRMPWWRLHWPRRRESFESPSLLIPQRAASPRAAFAQAGAYTSVDVYHAHLTERSELDLYGWLAVFHSKPVALWLAYRGKRKGDLLELYHTPLTAIPLPFRFDSACAKSLNELGRATHEATQQINQTRAQGRPWHLFFGELMQSENKEAVELQSLLHDTDQLIAPYFGISLPAIADHYSS